MLASGLGVSWAGTPCDWKLCSCLAISRSCCEGSRFKTAGMLAGGADEGAGVGVGECSATRDMSAMVSGALGGCYWRMEEGGGVLVLVCGGRGATAGCLEEGELSQAAGEQMKSGGAMVTAVNSARGVFTEIIRCDARDYGMERTDEKMPWLHASTRAT